MKLKPPLFWIKLKGLIIFGYVLETILLLVIGFIAIVFSFFDNFYSSILQKIWGWSFFGIGFGISVFCAAILGYVTQTEWAWRIISRILMKVPIHPIQRLVTTIEQWKLLWTFAEKHGAILAPFYNSEMRWPAIITGYFSYKSGGRYTYDVNILFLDIPFPKPATLRQEVLILASLTLEEAISYVTNAGAININRDLEELTLGVYFRSNPHFKSLKLNHN